VFSVSATSSSSAFYDFTGLQIRVALLRTEIIKNEISAMDVALKGGLISPEIAIGHVIEIGAGNLLQWGSSDAI
jgi:hypothetical protein